MVSWPSSSVLESDHEVASDYLGCCLFEGTLALFLGAGVSLGTGLPRWWELVNRCQDAISNTGELDCDRVNKDSSDKDLTTAMDEVESKCGNHEQYKTLVHEQLYSTADEDSALAGSRVLGALGAMMMRSRRGNCSEVITLNFDDVLERYLELHGFVSETIADFPTLFRGIDVRIYHPHGFLPKDKSATKSKKIFFSRRSFVEKLAYRDEWEKLTDDILARKVVLFVGVSPKDDTLAPALMRARDTIANGELRPTAFWMLGPNDPEECEATLRKYNIVPLRKSNYDEFSEFQLRVCRNAMTHVGAS